MAREAYRQAAAAVMIRYAATVCWLEVKNRVIRFITIADLHRRSVRARIGMQTMDAANCGVRTVRVAFG